MSELLRCQACGGAVIWDAAQSGAACLFCGTVALELELAAEPVPEPELLLPAEVSRATAEERFRTWASSSWFRPPQLRSAVVALHLIMLPAWRFHAGLETHWAGLRRAKQTKSGKAPVAGVEQVQLTTMVPASTGLSQGELTALQPFDERPAVAWADDADIIWEPPALTKQGARAQAHRVLADVHRRRIMAERGLLSAKVSAVVDDQDVHLLLVPVYIGTFRFRDRPWRFLVNAQTGVVVGEAPLDWRRVFAVALAVALVISVLAWFQWG